MDFIRKKHILSTATLLLMTEAAETAMAANNVDVQTYPDVLVTGDKNTVQKNGSYAGPRHLDYSQQIYGQSNSVSGSTQIDVVGDHNIIKNSDVSILGQSNKVDNLYGLSVGDDNILKGKLSGNDGWNGQINNVGGANEITNTSSNETLNNFGSGNIIKATGASSLGNFQKVDADHSVTLGDHSKNSRHNTVSVGAPNRERQITYVAKASEKTDAVNLDQMNVADEATLQSAKDHTNTMVQNEKTARTQGDEATLQSAKDHTNTMVQNEKTARTQGDEATLQSAKDHTNTMVQNETTARTQGDEATLQSAKDHTNTMVQNEKTARTQGDEATLQSAKDHTNTMVQNETTARTQGDEATLQSAKDHTNTMVQNETTARTQGDEATLQSAKDHTNTMVQNETTARTQGDEATLQSAKDHTNTMVQNETTARTQGDETTLQSAKDHTNDTAVQYDANKAGTSVTLKAADGTQIKNLAAGTEGTDAVNLDQMKASASNTLRQANIYTDGRITDLGNRMNKGLAALDGKIDDAQRHAYAGVAGAIAMSSIPQASPGHSSIGAGFGHFAGQQAAAFGYSHHWILDSHRGVIVKAAGMVTNQRDGGAMLGFGYEW